MFKVGDCVKCVSESSTNYGQFTEVTFVGCDFIECRYDSGEIGKGKFKYYVKTCNPINKVVGKIMGLKESFVLGLTSEPEKTYRKVGITNGDGILTEDGVKIFLTYLLSKTPQFKADVADGILADMESNKK